MRLTSFSVQNYRGFADRTEVELRPLTLLFGYNSAGKSALLRWLPIVAASMDRDATSALALDNDAARNASFDDILSRYSSSDKLSLGLRWHEPGTEEDLEVSFLLLWEARQRQQIVERMRIMWNARHEAHFQWTPDLEVPIDRRRYTVLIDDHPLEEHEVPFDGLLPRHEAFGHETIASLITGTLGQEMAALGYYVHWLTAVRALPERSKERGPRPRRLGSDGSHAGDFLAHDRLGSGQVLATVSAWFRHATGHDLDVSIQVDSSKKERFSLMLTPAGGQVPVRIPLPDTGEGMAQVLPVIVLGALARHGQLGEHPLLLIEHPELHLHPAIHADLAGYFCELTKDIGGTTTVLETHSENVLLRVQLAIARGELDPVKVIVHWVRSLAEGPSVVETVTFDDMARPQGNWPPRVFSSDIRQARELLEIRRKRSAP